MALLFEEHRIDELGADSDAFRGVASAAARLRAARSAALEADLDRIRAEGRPRSIVVAGSGAAVLAGDILESVAGSGFPVPVHTVRDYRLPGWVSGHDLVVAVASTSGHDAEVAANLAAEAARRGCRLLSVEPAGGPIAPYAEQSRSPQIVLPPAGDESQAPWGVVAALLTAVDAAGVPGVPDTSYEAAAVRLEETAQECRPGAESWENPAKTLALDLGGSLPVFWAATPPTSAAATRFASALAANARYPALCGRLPGALWDQFATADGPFGGTGPRSIFDDPVEDGATRLLAVLLRDSGESPEEAEDMTAVAEGARQRGVTVRELSAGEGHVLERLAGLIALADYASVYLAVAYGVDPLTHTLVVR
ncbi:glucose/mannose-6-phosphate isomerase [Lipingzhangella halophila]|uniref:Glucose/mannose-6-phosphate isomerase n=1 Tax=Lipingzhangella halophila TaxID=1783352 RepID=A0A7W7RKY6_9ACTN|nr:SIS domain-containing protein [Lipingzhangella halophila]MBB4933903.1 glucose/mannose-6-phosphate isomerase [Lipingzhangella halophila]